MHSASSSIQQLEITSPMIKNSFLYIFLTLVVAYSMCVEVNANETDSVITTVISQTKSKADDAEQNTSTGRVNYRSSDLELVDKKKYRQLVGLRFQLDVPQGSEITNGYIQFTADKTSRNQADLVIQGENSADAAAFTSKSGNLSSRSLISASASWSPVSWVSIEDAGFAQQTSDISAIIQEIVNREDWQQGNHIALLISGSGERTAVSFDGTPSQSPMLFVSYVDSEITDAEETECRDCTSSLYFVDRNHPNASDDNTGTDENQPWRSFVHAAAFAKAGDTVYVKKGIYTDGKVVLRHSGERGKEIILSAYPGHEREVVIKNAGFSSIGHSHIVLRGFKFMHTPSYGIRFQGPDDSNAPPAENITIANNHTYDTWSSGISVWGVKWGKNPGDYYNIKDVIIENNLLELGTNGGKNEIITVANGAVNIEVRYNEIRLGDPNMTGGDEGIDFKEGVRDSKIYGNLIHDLSDKAIYIDGGSDSHDPQITNIEIFDNIMWNLPSAGISITTEGMGDVDGIKVYNNVVYNVDGDGFLVYNHPGGAAEGGTVKNVQFINNTAYQTGNRHRGHGGFRVNHPSATGILFRNNIAWNNNGYDIRGESETIIDHNLCRETLCEVRTDPQFINIGELLKLKSTSPAIDRGTSMLAPSTDIAKKHRPEAVDLGAYEH